jgi:hypothetical protein
MRLPTEALKLTLDVAVIVMAASGVIEAVRFRPLSALAFCVAALVLAHARRLKQ